MLSYNSETGQFSWLRPPNRRLKIGSLAGCKMETGYVYIGLLGEDHYAHRLAWFYIHNEWPKEIDHRNGDKSDNSISNLRVATRSQNGMNKAKRKNTTHNIKGICWDKASKKYVARIYIDRRPTCLGYFATPEEAGQAYLEAGKKHYGEFFRPH